MRGRTTGHQLYLKGAFLFQNMKLFCKFSFLFKLWSIEISKLQENLVILRQHNNFTRHYSYDWYSKNISDKSSHPGDGGVLVVVDAEEGSELQQELCANGGVAMDTSHQAYLGLGRFRLVWFVGNLQGPDGPVLHTLAQTRQNNACYYQFHCRLLPSGLFCNDTQTVIPTIWRRGFEVSHQGYRWAGSQPVRVLGQ